MEVNENTKVCINKILGRDIIIENIKQTIQKNISSVIYVYGATGSGKTSLIKDILNDLDHEIVYLDIIDLKSKNIHKLLSYEVLLDNNVLHLLNKKIKKKSIVIDDVDMLKSLDSCIYKSLLKWIVNLKKKKIEIVIIFITNINANNHLKLLKKKCIVFELKCPTEVQLIEIIKLLFVNVEVKYYKTIVNYSKYNLIKLMDLLSLYKNDNEIMRYLDNIVPNENERDTYTILYNLYNKSYNIGEHNNLILEGNRTIMGLLFHENILKAIYEKDKKKMINRYIELLKNICYADYLDRVSFQKQIWRLSEYSLLIKIFYNNYLLLNDNNPKDIKQNGNTNLNQLEGFEKMCKTQNESLYDYHFTKVITRYSSEYSNYNFIYNMCNIYSLDKIELFLFFTELKKVFLDFDTLHISDNTISSKHIKLDAFKVKLLKFIKAFELLDLKQSELLRMYKYLDVIYNNEFQYNYDKDNICNDNDDLELLQENYVI